MIIRVMHGSSPIEPRGFLPGRALSVLALARMRARSFLDLGALRTSLPLGLSLALGVTVAREAFAAPPDLGPPDRLPPETAVLADSLIRAGMPELVDELLADGARAHRVLVARAYVVAAAAREDPAKCDADLEAAEAAYREALSVSNDPPWRADVRRRLSAIRWRAELADLILLQRCAADVERFEAYGNLAPIPPRLAARLVAAIGEFRRTEAALQELRRDRRTTTTQAAPAAGANDNPETAADELLRTCSRHLAWALVVEARLLPESDVRRAANLREALERYKANAAGGATTDTAVAPAIGEAIALREMRRFDEAIAKLTPLAESTNDAANRARARFELARTKWRAGDPREAARLFASVSSANEPTSRPADSDADRFWVELAPVMRAAALLAEADAGSPRAKELRMLANEAFGALRLRGERWSSLIDAYQKKQSTLAAVPASQPLPDRMEAARQAMAAGKHAHAADAWRTILADPRGEPTAKLDVVRLDLAECLSKTDQPREAAELAGQVAVSTGDAALARRAATLATEAWRRVVAASALRDDELAMARAYRMLLERVKEWPASDDAALAAGGALQRAALWDDARVAYALVPKTSGHYWPARIAMVRCREAILRGDGPEGAAGATPSISNPAPSSNAPAPAAQPIPKALTAAALGRAGDVATEWEQLSRELDFAATADKTRRLELTALRDVAVLNAVEWLVRPDLGRYQEALQRLAAIDQPALPDNMRTRMLAFRVACYRALRTYDKLDAALAEFLPKASAETARPLLRGLVEELELEVGRLVNAGQPADARELAAEMVPMVRRVLEWLQAQRSQGSELPGLRLSVARLMVHAGQAVDALPLLEQAARDRSGDDQVRRYLALTYEQVARTRSDAPLDMADKAERAWAKFLDDRGLRQRAPHRYWEARYYWLRWQLDRGSPEFVAREIDRDRTAQPDLGGTPWRERLQELLEKARALSGR